MRVAQVWQGTASKHAAAAIASLKSHKLHQNGGIGKPWTSWTGSTKPYQRETFLLAITAPWALQCLPGLGGTATYMGDVSSLASQWTTTQTPASNILAGSVNSSVIWEQQKDPVHFLFPCCSWRGTDVLKFYSANQMKRKWSWARRLWRASQKSPFSENPSSLLKGILAFILNNSDALIPVVVEKI